MAVTPDGAQLWISQRLSNRVDVIDTLTNKDLFGFEVPSATGIGFNPSGTFAYLASGTSPGYIQVVNMQNYQQVTQITVGNLPHVVAVTPTGKHVFVTNLGDVTISQIDTDVYKRQFPPRPSR